VVLANCHLGKPRSLSAVIDDRNRVTHYKTYRTDYFECVLSGAKGRGNESERLDYRHDPKDFYRTELSNDLTQFLVHGVEDRIILIGYLGDYLSDSLYYYKNTRITPFNRYYDDDGILPDSYDTEISAQIVTALERQTFLNDVRWPGRAAILTFFCGVNFLILIFFRTRWIWVNVVIAFISFLGSMILGGLLMVVLFQESIYLSLDELPIMIVLLSGSILVQQIVELRKSSN
jgi:hypothetical protein